MKNHRALAITLRLFAGSLLFGLLFFGSGPIARTSARGASEQVVFSGTGTFGSGSSLAGSPFGFWIWCEAESDNKYEGECRGSIYIYALRLTKHVEDAEEPGIVELSDGIYRMTVASSDGRISAVLQNADEPTRGPTNTIQVTFTTPSVGSGASTNAVVIVSGS